MSHLIAAVIFIFVVQSNYFAHSQSVVETELTEVKNVVWISKLFHDTMITFTPKSNFNLECTRHGKLYGKHLEMNSYWAVRMLDASVLSMTGLVEGNAKQLGHADQCIHTEIPFPNFSTQYCLPSATFSLKHGVHTSFIIGDQDVPLKNASKNIWYFMESKKYIRNTFKWGICVPDACTADDIKTSLQNMFSESFEKHGIDFKINLNSVNCYTKSENRKMPIQGVLWIYGIICLITLSAIGTTLDYHKRYHANHEINRRKQNISISSKPCLDANNVQTNVEVYKYKDSVTNGTGVLDKRNDIGTNNEETSIRQRKLNINETKIVSKENEDLLMGKTESAVQLKKENAIVSFLISFSMITNTEIICTPGADSELTNMNGMRVIVNYLSIMVHRVMFSFGYARNQEFVEKVIENPNYFLWTSTMHVLDTFFFLTGYLLARYFIRKKLKNQKINFFSLLINRLLRFYPIFFTFIAFTIWVLPYIQEGPLWKEYHDTEAENCKQYWLYNVFMIASLFDGAKFCGIGTWYLSTDFQLFMLSIALLYIIEKCTQYRNKILWLSFFLAHFLPPIFIYFYNGTSFPYPSVKYYQEMVYSPHYMTMERKFYIRCPPYIYGICTAYLVNKLKNIKFQFNGVQIVFMFFSLLIAQFVIFYMGALFLLPDRKYDVWEHVWFNPLYRFVWGSAVCSLIITHACGGTGIISKFLSHPFFQPLSQLSFHMFLINIYLIQIDTFTTQSAEYTNIFKVFHRSLGDFAMSAFFAYFTTILIQMPADKLRRKIIPSE